MLKSITTLAFILFSSVHFVAEAAESFSIDAYKNCFDTTSQTGGIATFQLAQGRYVVSILKNKMSCSNGNLAGGCLINSVIMSGGAGAARWGLFIQAPTVVDVSGSTNLTAFVVDNNCGDNTGTATLRFQKAN